VATKAAHRYRAFSWDPVCFLGYNSLTYKPPMTKRARFWGFHGLNPAPVPPDLLKNGRVVPSWRLGVAPPLATDIQVNGLFVFLRSNFGWFR
jgi:hypothetical protein